MQRSIDRRLDALEERVHIAGQPCVVLFARDGETRDETIARALRGPDASRIGSKTVIVVFDRRVAGVL